MWSGTALLRSSPLRPPWLDERTGVSCMPGIAVRCGKGMMRGRHRRSGISGR